MKAEDYRSETGEISGFKVNIITYKIMDNFYCKVDNVDPGATIAHSEAKTFDQALQLALAKASRRLGEAGKD